MLVYQGGFGNISYQIQLDPHKDIDKYTLQSYFFIYDNFVFC